MDESSSVGSVGKHSRGSSTATSSNDTAASSVSGAVNTKDDGTSFNKPWEVSKSPDATAIYSPWSDEWTDAAMGASTFPQQIESIQEAPKKEKKKSYGPDIVWICRATQLVPLMHLLFPGEPVFYDGEFVHFKLRILATGIIIFKQVLGRGAVVNSAGKPIYDVYPSYPSKGKFTKHYEILEKRFAPSKYMVELPDTWFENGAQPASEVEAELRVIFHGRPVVMHDHRGDTTAFLYETANSIMHDNGATIVDTQQLYAGAIPDAGDPSQPSLAKTCKFILGEDPQADGNHSPVKDADGVRKLWLALNPDYNRAAELAKLHATGWTPQRYPRQIPSTSAVEAELEAEVEVDKALIEAGLMVLLARAASTFVRRLPSTALAAISIPLLFAAAPLPMVVVAIGAVLLVVEATSALQQALSSSRILTSLPWEKSDGVAEHGTYIF
ncbi:hypothetical protein CLAFUW4_07248 [Fulvia fulva]|uniref:Transmembrane protein n=1 Tax=Passalora fulva TaxID=5499 RepID=A0A9Q8PAC4_PASFU|nr:uncharacterized protein CLAFUR5_07379 [Fulvia fulva]KAK4621885.1 hypothetical protein CLAFUR4_07256 [Fulvia fulva]KAK4622923.1 hypothetical protein CLAFUR0_07253 [Fulvia fulva]UJO18816.1 hypothetical protein CLAFUR5_07379 [Fulvia fulva]WPV16210.1 hypothetical protein CLAFUW4_07248 [Fulvia fulva]WPV30623.1 hypothetical protein CLAFUW7_07249 [Fulvia fulva]